MSEVQKLIDALKAKAAELEQHAGKDLAAAEARVIQVKDAVLAELATLLAELKGHGGN